MRGRHIHTERASPAAEDVVRDGGELVGDPVGDPGAHAGPAVRPDHHPAVKLHGTQGGPGGDLHQHSHLSITTLNTTHLLTSRKPVGRKRILVHSREVLQGCNSSHCKGLTIF